MFRCYITQAKCFLRGTGIFVLSASFHTSIKFMSCLSFELPLLYPSWEATSEGSWMPSGDQSLHTWSCRGLDLRAHPCPSATSHCWDVQAGQQWGLSHSPSWSCRTVLSHIGMWAAGQSRCVGEARGDASNNFFQAGRSKLLRACPAQLWESLFPYWGNWWFKQNPAQTPLE